MKTDFVAFKTEMDEWVKDFTRDMSSVKNAHGKVEDLAQNVDHNYELIQELRNELKMLKEEVGALRTLQYISIRTQSEKH